MGQAKINIINKKARFEYEFLETFQAGIKLRGSEIKSIRNGKAALQDAFAFFKGNEMWVKNLFIAEYDEASYNNHEPLRERKLLLNRKELDKLARKITDVGLTIIVYKLFINDKGFAKLEIALAKGKKLYDKRESIKERDTKRMLDRLHKG